MNELSQIAPSGTLPADVDFSDIVVRTDRTGGGYLNCEVSFTIERIAPHMGRQSLPLWAVPAPLVAAMRERFGMPVEPVEFADMAWVVTDMSVFVGLHFGAGSHIDFSVVSIDYGTSASSDHFVPQMHWHPILDAFIQRWLNQR